MLVEIDRFLRRTGMTRRQLSRLALGDSGALDKIVNGHREFTEYNMGRIRRWMTENPDGVLPSPRAQRRAGL